MRKSKRAPNLNRYLTECGLLYRGFHCYLPVVRESEDEFIWGQSHPFTITIKVCQRTKYTERLLLFFEGDRPQNWWQDWVLELQLYHDVFAAEVTGSQAAMTEGHLALKALPFDDKIRFHHLLLEWLVIRMTTSIP